VDVKPVTPSGQAGGRDASEQALLARLEKRERTMIALTRVIAIGGVISALIFALVLYGIYVATDLTRQEVRLNKQALDLARESMQRQLRAYVGVQDFKCGGCGDNAGADEVVLTATNDGQTPALNVYARIGWSADARCGASDGSFSYSYSQARYFRASRSLVKGARDATTFDPNRESIQQARASGTKLCVYGTINYATVFSDLAERETRFCFWYSRGSERSPCEDHNGQN